MTGANVLVAVFAERESNATFFLNEQDMTRFDAVNFVSHGISKRSDISEPRGDLSIPENTASGDGSAADTSKSGQPRGLIFISHSDADKNTIAPVI